MTTRTKIFSLIIIILVVSLSFTIWKFLNIEKYPLVFNNQKVVLERSKKGITRGTFWEISKKEITHIQDYLEDDSPIGSNLLFAPRFDTFYDLQPGGYSIFRLISQADLDTVLQEKQTEGTNEAVLKRTSCEISNYKLGSIQAKAMKCTLDMRNPQNISQGLEEYTVDCYLPIQDMYLAYEQKLKPMGDVNLCDQLATMGIQNIYLQTNVDLSIAKSLSCIQNGGTWIAKHKECELTGKGSDWAKTTCLKLGGQFESCASPCRHKKTPGMCPAVCVEICKF